MARRDASTARLSSRAELAVAGGFFVAGWLFILAINRWHVGAPVFFLSLGWLAVVLCGLFFWGSARAAAGEGTGPEQEGFALNAGRVEELEKEKKALLKAIRDVEFDRDMGKMSEEDAVEISRVYRARAIDILKELEGDEAGGPAASLDRVIEREVRARLALAGVASRKKGTEAPAESKPAKAESKPAKAESKPAKAESKPAKAESKPEVNAASAEPPASDPGEPPGESGNSAGQGPEEREDA
jgi:hypothetical protein